MWELSKVEPEPDICDGSGSVSLQLKLDILKFKHKLHQGRKADPQRKDSCSQITSTGTGNSFIFVGSETNYLYGTVYKTYMRKLGNQQLFKKKLFKFH